MGRASYKRQQITSGLVVSVDAGSQFKIGTQFLSASENLLAVNSYAG
jgi:hypothetical protein